MRIHAILPSALLALAVALTLPACQQSGNPDRDGSSSAASAEDNTTTQPDRDAATGNNGDGMLTDTTGGAPMPADNTSTTDPSGGTGSGNAQPGSSGTGEHGTGNGGH